MFKVGNWIKTKGGRIFLPIAVTVALIVGVMGVQVGFAGVQFAPSDSSVSSNITLKHMQTVGRDDMFTVTIGTPAYAAEDPDYTCDGTADEVEFNQAYDAIPSTGGKIRVYCADYYFAAPLDMDEEKAVIIDFQGSQIYPSAAVTAIRVAQPWAGYAPQNRMIEIMNVRMHAVGVAGITGILIEDTPIVKITNFQFFGDGATSLGIVEDSISMYNEEQYYERIRLHWCAKGIYFKKTGGTGAGGTNLNDVYINDCTVGIEVGTGISMGACDWRNVKIWVNDNQDGLYVNGRLWPVSGNISFESVGTPVNLDAIALGVAAELGENNLQGNDLQVNFIGNFTNFVNNAGTAYVGFANLYKEKFVSVGGAWGTGTECNLGTYEAYQLADAASEYFVVTMKCPEDFLWLEGIYLVWAHEAGVAATDIYWFMHADVGTCTEDFDTHTYTPAYGTTAALAANKIACQLPANVLSPVDLFPADYIGIQVQRDATDPADTLNQDIKVLGILFRYIGN